MEQVPPMPVDPKALKGLFMRMLVAEGICVAVAIAAFAGFVLGLGKASLAVFALALVAGFGAQIWFIGAWAKATAKA